MARRRTTKQRTRKGKIADLDKRAKNFEKRSVKAFEKGRVSEGKRLLKRSLGMRDRVLRLVFKSAGHGVPASKRKR